MKRSTLLTIVAGAFALALIAVPLGSAAAPANDNFADAAVVVSLPFTQTVAVSEATVEPSEPVWWSGQSRTVWWSFTPATTGLHRISRSSSDVWAFLSIYRADSTGFSGLTRLSWGGPSSYDFTLDAGTTYYVQAGDDYPYGWTNSVTVSIEQLLPPANDDFANAIAFTSDDLPFSASLDFTAATIEPDEPMGCGGSTFGQSLWYAFTPTLSGGYGGNPAVSAVNVYTGTTIDNLTSVACSQWWGLAFHANAGTTYYLQVYGGGLGIDLLPPPDVQYSYGPGDPSVFDEVSFSEGGGYWNPSKASWAWDFGDGTTGTGSSISHRFARDGDYTASVTVTTVDGRTNTDTQVIAVRTHDVAILWSSTPGRGRVDRAAPIEVGIGNTRYPETVQVDFYKSTPAGFQFIGSITKTVPVMKKTKTVTFSLTYAFTSDDLAVGKVSFQAVATIQGARDALSADNSVTFPPTVITK